MREDADEQPPAGVEEGLGRSMVDLGVVKVNPD
jgi:hypothetical protein